MGAGDGGGGWGVKEVFEILNEFYVQGFLSRCISIQEPFLPLNSCE